MIRYRDSEEDLINISDDEDLETAYAIAETQLSNNLKLLVSFKNDPLNTSQSIHQN